MTELVAYMVLFIAAGVGFLVLPLVIGKLIRPERPDPEKGTVYECGEPTIGSAWIQFDLRFYVVALLFVIFDVEMAFFFPWAVVFGSANKLADPNLPDAERVQLCSQLGADIPVSQTPDVPGKIVPRSQLQPHLIDEQRAGAKQLAWLAFADVLVFFGVLLVGFAYLWKRGDLEWVRSVAAQAKGEPGASTLSAGRVA
jgi:NADH-quinone oxidoreductase subunit A